ncbi:MULTISPECIES: alpha/beta fold hydrolase [unclassified Streptomyces]|uniref:alpha/beta hydrolase n=1 Tax=unclassified Streptomyces TaxID=2593676 RepID=UPI00343A1123
MTSAPNTIVLIHGLWMTPLAWEHWAARYEERGFTVLTPGYPGIEPGEAGVAALREDASAIAGVGVREVLEHLAAVIDALDSPPIIMGHSFGGTFAQLLVGAGLGAAGVSIDGAAVKGVNAMPFSELRSVLPVLKDPANAHRAVPLTAEQFHYAFTNTLDEKASLAAYSRYAVPTPARILFQGGLAAVTPHAATTFDFADGDRAPLLFVSGGSDHILPPAVQRQNYEKNAKHSAAVTAHTVFDGRDHFTCGEPGWEAVADFALDWALNPRAGVLDATPDDSR